MIKIKQNKDDIKEKVKFNFTRKKIRKKNLQKEYAENIGKQLNELLNN